VVVLTTSAADQDIRTGYRHHGNCFVTKPVDLDEFFQVVEQIAHFWLTVAHLPPE
jgi:CheY-like chemotaxis protein